MTGFKVLLLAGTVTLSGVAIAQQEQSAPPPAATSNRKVVSDAVIEANVLKALASAPDIANQNIQSTSVYGVVTLSGNVIDEASRQKADDLVSRVSGVQKVVDEMEIGGAATQAQGPNQPDAQPDAQQAQGQPDGYPPPPQGSQAQYPQTGYPGAPEYPNNAPRNSGPQQGYPQNAQGYPPQQQQGYPPQQGQNYPPQQGPNYPPQGQNYPPQGYSRQGGPGNGEVYGAQRAGDRVTIPPGALLRVRINEGLSSNRNQPGAAFDGVVLNDVIADGAVAIPRGATVQGAVVTATASGAISGRGELTLQLTNVILAGRTFPLNSDVWSRATGDKTVHTVNNAIGLGVLGAIIGGVAGGGSGAAIGAAAGGATGVATSAASPRGQVMIPPEAILTFHLTAPTPVVTVSQGEMDRLGYGIPNGNQQPQMQRRMPPPAYGRPYPYPY